MACQNHEILGMSSMTRVRKKVNIRIVESWDTIRIRVRLPKRIVSIRLMQKELDDAHICSLKSKTESWVYDSTNSSMLPQVENHLLTIS